MLAPYWDWPEVFIGCIDAWTSGGKWVLDYIYTRGITICVTFMKCFKDRFIKVISYKNSLLF